jgi:hypothetical protein
MDTPMSQVAEHQRRALDFMLDALGLREAYEAVSRLPRTRELEHTAAALETELEAIVAAPREREPNDI